MNTTIPTFVVQEIKYDGHSKPTHISYGIHSMDIVYGPDGDRWKSTQKKTLGSTTEVLYGDGYERVTSGDTTRHYYYLSGNVLMIRQEGAADKYYYMLTDHHGSIIRAYAEDGTDVFSTSYDAWGKQTVGKNSIGLRRGYTGHEMLADFKLINMNGRLYDPLIGRFLSPDNYVQLPDNSQNFNRYSYCLNNPLKYVDPSGEFFGIDDALFFSIAAGAIIGGMQMEMSVGKFWKGALIGGANAATTYGIGQWLGAVGAFDHEVIRAGMHGLWGGLLNTFKGDNFFTGLISGAASSRIGSFAQSVNFNSNLMLASAAAIGGVGSWTVGGNFLEGATQGMTIGLFNHSLHDNDELMGNPAKCEVLPDGTFVAPSDLKGITVYASRLKINLNYPIEKPLKTIYPEFEVLMLGRSLVVGAFQGIWSTLRNETGGMKQWLRTGVSYSKKGGFDTKSIRWGASPHHADKIGNSTLRKYNQSLRNTRISGNNWRTADKGHFHLKWRNNNTDEWLWFR